MRRTRHINKLIYALAAILSTQTKSAHDIDRIAAEMAGRNLAVASGSASMESDLLSLKAENQLEAPEIEFEHLWGGKGAKDKTGITVSQGFDWPGVYAARSKAISIQKQTIGLLHRANLLDKALEAKLAIYDLIYARQQLALVDTISANIGRILAATESGYRRGEYTILDVNRLKVETVNIQRRHRDIASRIAMLTASINALNGGNDASEMTDGLNAFPPEHMLSYGEYADEADRLDPTIEAARMGQQAAKQMETAEKRSSFPGFSIGYRYSREEGINFHGFTAGISLPFLRKNYRKESAKALALANSYDGNEALVSRIAQIKASYENASRLRDDNAAFAAVFENSDNIRLLSRAYAGGQMSSVEYLTDINYFLDANLTYLQSRYDYAIALAQLNRYTLLQYL